MSNSPTIWFNVTTSHYWTRPPVGIVRVELEIQKFLKAFYNERLRDCVYRNGVFYPVEEGVQLAAPTADGGFFWPDKSYEFPRLHTFEWTKSVTRGVPQTPVEQVTFAAPKVDSMKFGDVLISFGADWDSVGLTDAIYRLRTKGGVKIVSCCYDLIPILYPQYCVGEVAEKFKEYFGDLSWGSDLMFCISKKTESDYRQLVQEMGCHQPETDVIPLGTNIKKSVDKPSPEIESLLKEDFILFVSTIERRKNHEALYKAYHLLCSMGYKDKLPKLVFVGMPGWGVNDLLKDLQIDRTTRDLIVQLHHVSDSDLNALYANCRFFVYPSFYEGWGLPVAEALAHGKFVLSSNRGSLPEVGGDLVEYVDPWSSRAWADAILKYATSPALVQEREKAVRDLYHPIQWNEVGQHVAEAIDRLVLRKVDRIEIDAGYSLQTLTGVRAGPRIISSGSSGCLAYGPYIQLPPCSLNVSIDYHCLGGHAGLVSVFLKSHKGSVVHSQIEQEMGDEEMEGKLILPQVDIPENVDDLEVVVETSVGVRVAIGKIALDLGSAE